MAPTSEGFNTDNGIVGNLAVTDIFRLFFFCVTMIKEALCVFSVITLEVTGCLYRKKIS